MVLVAEYGLHTPASHQELQAIYKLRLYALRSAHHWIGNELESIRMGRGGGGSRFWRLLFHFHWSSAISDLWCPVACATGLRYQTGICAFALQARSPRAVQSVVIAAAPLHSQCRADQCECSCDTPCRAIRFGKETFPRHLWHFKCNPPLPFLSLSFSCVLHT